MSPPSIFSTSARFSARTRASSAATAGARASEQPDEDEGDPQTRKLAVVRALHEAGVFDRLQALVAANDETEPDANPAQGDAGTGQAV